MSLTGSARVGRRFRLLSQARQIHELHLLLHLSYPARRLPTLGFCPPCRSGNSIGPWHPMEFAQQGNYADRLTALEKQFCYLTEQLNAESTYICHKSLRIKYADARFRWSVSGWLMAALALTVECLFHRVESQYRHFLLRVSEPRRQVRRVRWRRRKRATKSTVWGFSPFQMFNMG
jgi:hypothetical protein